MLTAAHCEVEDGWEWFTPEGDLSVGSHSSTTSCTRGGGVLTGETYEGRVYRGSWQSGSSANVTSAADAVVDEYVFVSGGMSGQHMVIVDAINKYENLGPFCGTLVGPGFHTIDEQGDGSVGEGDSGGPVYKYVGAYDVRPKGIILAGLPNYTATCEGKQGRTCSSRGFHGNINSNLSRMNLTLQ